MAAQHRQNVTALISRHRNTIIPINPPKPLSSSHHRRGDSARAAQHQKWLQQTRPTGPTQHAALRRNFQPPTSESFKIPRSLLSRHISSSSISTFTQNTTTTSTMADTPETTATSPQATSTADPTDSKNNPIIIAPLQSIAKFKARSHDTSKEVHIPLLQSHTHNAAVQCGPTVVLVGDSMLERMTTTGSTPNFTAPWPSPAMLSDAALAALHPAADTDIPSPRRLDRVFNAGVGGDKIQNVAYRLVGAEPEGGEGGGLPGLLPMLAACGTVRVWVVQAGTNNLSPKKGLVERDCEALEVLLGTLLGVNPRGGECKVLVTGLFYRKDVSVELVDQANGKIREVVKRLQERCGVGRVVFLAPTAGVKTEEHLVDHVHLNLEGYQLWAAELFPAVKAILDSTMN
ncbi:SGNH hydrolase-type esterase domain-containing protein [Chaetomium fimeti]|uniref:SGNH hydrolase-type esterase domain-containing protein n=1 Tax=Chaetomium fimeti TaxID=1854472 RepID=A0AAE0LRZ0_9PEZI|nr:SGNH hydrolase-type esterase domain-containing protein [Chaetomium fimeti]